VKSFTPQRFFDSRHWSCTSTQKRRGPKPPFLLVDVLEPRTLEDSRFLGVISEGWPLVLSGDNLALRRVDVTGIDAASCCCYLGAEHLLELRDCHDFLLRCLLTSRTIRDAAGGVKPLFLLGPKRPRIVLVGAGLRSCTSPGKEKGSSYEKPSLVIGSPVAVPTTRHRLPLRSR
jgi:hypothetical protein